MTFKFTNNGLKLFSNFFQPCFIVVVFSKLAGNVLFVNEYRKVASSSMPWIVEHYQIFRRLMKGKFDAYVL